VQVGRVTAVYWPGEGTAAAALAEFADETDDWPGIERPSQRPIRLIIVRSARRFDSLSAHRLPPWGAGATFPASRTILLRLEGDPRQVLRHELAHLALHDAVPRVPLWFDEGYAAVAAGEWGRLDALMMNWRLLAGRPPTLDEVTRDLRQGLATAQTAYAFATTAVLYLERLGKDRGLQPLIQNLAVEGDFDRALRTTYGMTEAQFETDWRAELRGRYGWLLVFASFATLWLLVLATLAVGWRYRRRRDRLRRQALDEGWVVPSEPEGPGA
jgi:Peptidase MA superfamily